MESKQIRIARKSPLGIVTAWRDDGEIYIRESLDRGRDVQTVALSPKELMKIAEAFKEAK